MDIIKPLFTVLVNKSQQQQEKNSSECRESTMGLLGESQLMYSTAEYVQAQELC